MNLQPHLTLRCTDRCGPGGCGSCPTVELDAWWPYLFQAHSECNWDDEEGRPPWVAGMSAADLEACLCCETRPLVPKCAPSEPRFGDGSGNPWFGWWYDPADPISGDAHGFVVHSLTAQDPAEFTASRAEKLRGRVALVDGLLLCEATIEAVGVSKQAARWLFKRLKRELEGSGLCCGRAADIFVDCCPGEQSGLRRLSGVSEFNLVESATEEPWTASGVVFSLVFSADPLATEPAAAVSAAGAFLGVGAVPSCTVPTTPEFVTSLAPKAVRRTDLVLQTSGTLLACPVDWDTFDPATQYMRIRDASADDPAAEQCPLQISLDLTADPPVITPLQPTLYQTEILDRITAGTGIDCSNPLEVVELVISNPDYRPTCDTCPTGIRGHACANATGAILDGDGFLDPQDAGWGGGAAPSVATTWDWIQATDPSPPAWLQTLFDYFECLDLMVDYRLLWAEYSAAFPVGADRIRVYFYPDGSLMFTPTNSGGGFLCAWARYIFEAPGLPGRSGYASCEPGVVYPPTPVPALDDVCGTIPNECLEVIRIANPTQDGPCVELTIDGSGVVTSPLDPTVDQLARAQWSFGPCSAVTTPDCPAVIPNPAPVTIDTVTGIATPVGWAPGFGFPGDTPGTQFVVTAVDGVPISLDPLEAGVVVDVPVVDTSCDPPCGAVAAPAPTLVPSECFVPIAGDRTFIVAEAAGLSPSRTYMPSWRVQAVPGVGGLLEQPEVHIWSGPAGSPAPTLGTLADFICSPQVSVARFAELKESRAASYTAEGLLIECAEGVWRDALAGWTDASELWRPPTICGAGVAYLIVFFPTTSAAPVVSFDVVPVDSP